MYKDIDRIKLCLEVHLIDKKDAELKVIYVDEDISKLEEDTLYSDYLNFTIKKGTELNYKPSSIIIPTIRKIHNFDKIVSYKFFSDISRKYLLNLLASKILNFIGKFGKNPDSRIVYLNDKWFFY
jgi:hypothetical protein